MQDVSRRTSEQQQESRKACEEKRGIAMKKRLLLSFLAMIIAISPVNAVAFARGYDSTEKTPTNPLVVERVDVLHTEAVNDPTFSLEKSRQESIKKSIANSAGGYWDVGGSPQYEPNNFGRIRATGYSANYSDNHFLLNTYHYTRTFFGSENNPYGDSGRVWEEGIVRAYGPYVASQYTTGKVHKVFYGTEA